MTSAVRQTAVGRAMLACALALAFLAAPAAEAADAFYEGMLRKGTDAYNRRDFSTAARALRIACFGLLDEPPLLALGLTRLALAQAAAGNADAFRETFARLSDVETRFNAYSAAQLSDAERSAFEQQAVRLIGEPALRGNEAFAHLAGSEAERISAVPPRRGRRGTQAVTSPPPPAPTATATPNRAAAEAPPVATPTPPAAAASGALSDPPAPSPTPRVEAELAPTTSRNTEEQPPASTVAPPASAATPPAPTATPRPSPTPRVEQASTALPFAARREMQRAEDLAAENQVQEAFDLARKIADEYPRSARAQHLAAELAYRGARWSDALNYFRRGGDPGDGQPLLLFYLAVTLFETGDRDGAATALQRSLEKIRRTDYVESYVRKIGQS